ncbi:MAG TPA: DinB family protein [Niabella sp.]|nr:DinB family protein [Niabella sp.]HOZ98199.1 DinB family protein [Niabella sp.]HQW16240.1 DinB family protein [Niabella sp.]HQX21473.1 DinB family protein [Niabella sp.]HQX42525.1 DinB family protein [Niabella sp.]
MQTKQLLDELTTLTLQHLEAVKEFQQQSDETLNQKTNLQSWNAVECIEHLNRYGKFYLPEINERIKASKTPPSPEFKTGWLGNYFAKSMLPKEKLNKMKTFAPMNPITSEVKRNVLDVFEQQLKTMLTLLQDAEKVNLTKVKTSISISPFVKLRLGDTFRVVIYHNERHIQQAKRAMAGQ